jgi:HK97 gp10 family phage protein
VTEGVRVEGLDLVLSNLRRVRSGYRGEQKQIHSAVGQPVLVRARQRARSRTGRLRSSIRLRATSAEIEFEADTEYAGFQHWGTRHMTGTRYLTEPLRELEAKLVHDYQKLTERFIDRVWVDN